MTEKTFKCVDCKRDLPVQTGGGTGYVLSETYGVRNNVDTSGPAGKVCYACCGKADRRSLETDNRATLYLTYKDGKNTVSNWPGTMVFPARVKEGDHNMNIIRRDVWFEDHTGQAWWGVQYGENSDIVRCRKLKQVK